MDPISSIRLVSAAGEEGLPLVGYDALSPFIAWLFGSGPLAEGIAPIVHFLSFLWTGYAIFAYALSAFLLYLYVYATVRLGQLEELQDEMVAKSEELYDQQYRTGAKNDRLADILVHITSDNPNDWKLAIIEADIILDETLKRAGYTGASLGERLRSISPSRLQSLDDAWQAHKIRNQVAHGGVDFVLTKRLAEDTIKQYRRVFEELGV